MSADRNYVDICNWATEAFNLADDLLERLSDEEIRELQGLVNQEAEASKGRSLTIKLVKEVVDAEVAYRKPSNEHS